LPCCSFPSGNRDMRVVTGRKAGSTRLVALRCGRSGRRSTKDRTLHRANFLFFFGCRKRPARAVHLAMNDPPGSSREHGDVEDRRREWRRTASMPSGLPTRSLHPKNTEDGARTNGCIGARMAGGGAAEPSRRRRNRACHGHRGKVRGGGEKRRGGGGERIGKKERSLERKEK